MHGGDPVPEKVIARNGISKPQKSTKRAIFSVQTTARHPPRRCKKPVAPKIIDTLPREAPNADCSEVANEPKV